jgi:hypothetical protein
MLLRNRFIQKLSGTFVERMGLGMLCQWQLPWLASRKEKEIVSLLRGVRKGGRSLLTSFEAFLIYSVARAQAHLDGAFAEVGVYRGASAKLICEVKGDKPLHLFDTFAGLPKSIDVDRNVHRVGQYRADLASVQEYLRDYDNVHYHQGVFPESTSSVADQSYALAHFDVDLYEGTQACLEYFYPRMSPGGIIVSHDYDWASGVRKAFDEFFADKREQIVEMPTTQCLVWKL